MAKGPQSASHGIFPRIAFVNKASEPLGIELDQLVRVLAKQLDNDFIPIWGYPARLRATDVPDPDEWQIVFLDNADAASALGYHDITADGQPVSKVFVKSIREADDKVSVTASHELLEMLIDPGAQLWAQGNNGVFYAYEMCDAVEGEEYEIDNVAVSDFVHPSFFESWHEPNSIQFDHLKRVSRPFQTLQRGYQIVSNGNAVKEIFGSRGKKRHFREVEDRAMHRSEYRKLRASVSSHAGLAADSAASYHARHAASLDYAARYLRYLAKADDPFEGWDLPSVRRPQSGDDPFSGFNLPGSRNMASRAMLRMQFPVPPDDDDPFDGFDLPPSRS